MDPLLWGAVLLAIGLALAMLEVFIPSGGIIGFLSLICIVGAVVLAFREGRWTGMGFMGVALVCLPIGLSLALKWWPHTPMGRRVLLPVLKADDVLPQAELREQLRALVGKTGRAKSLMLPSGAVQIGDETFDALSEGMAIEVGQRVRVVEVRGTRVVVRPATDDVAERDPRDPLSRPIDSLGGDPFREPTA